MEIFSFFGVALFYCSIFVVPQSTALPLSSNATNFQSNIDDFFKSITKIASLNDKQFTKVSQQINEIGIKLNESTSECYEALITTFNHGFNTSWSSKLINSNSFFTSTFLSSLISEKFSSLGDFEDCMSVSGVESVAHTDKNKSTASVGAKYCLVRLQTPQMPYPSERETFQMKGSTSHMMELASKWLAKGNQVHFLSGICAPSVCNTKQLTDLIDECNNQNFAEFLNGMEITIGYCQQKRQIAEYSFGFQVARLIMLTFIVIGLGGTVLHCALAYMKRHQVRLLSESTVLESIRKIAKCFNISYNMKRLFSSNVQRRQHELDTSFISGLRALLIIGSVFVHSHTFLSVYLLSQVSVFDKQFSFYSHYKLEHPLRYNLVYRSFLLVDLFFVLSGFLATYKVLTAGKKVPNFLSYALHHYVRLAPSMIAILCLTILAQHWGSGPLFHQSITDPYVKPCYDYWWTHVLLINNFWTLDKMCGANLYFIACLFDLHLILYVTLWLYYRAPRKSIIFTLALIAASLLLFLLYTVFSAPAVPTLADFQMQNMQTPLPLEAIRLYYTSPQSHIVAYFSGALIAMRVLAKKDHFSKYASPLAALSTLAFLLGTMFPLEELSEKERQSALFMAAFLLFFAVVILSESLFFYFLLLVRSSPFKQFLSSSLLAPIGRLSLSIYLLNPLVNWTRLHQVRQTAPLTMEHLRNMFFVDLFRTLFWAIFLYLFVEAPITNVRNLVMEQMLNKKLVTTTTTKQSSDNEEEIVTCL